MGGVTPLAGGWSPRTADGGTTGCSDSDAVTSAVGLQDGVERAAEVGQVAVVDAAVVELVGEFLEQTGPVPPRWRDRYPHLHRALYDPD
jgi:hypothetical protein